VVWCGRLQRWKGAHVFLEAAARVRRDVPAARFLVVGGALFGLEAAYEGELHALARGLGLGEDVRFTGQQADPGPFLAAADVIVHSSVCPEAFGLVVLEGMAHGKPVVASAAGGPEEIVEPGVTGRLVPPNDADALAQALITLMRDDSLRAEMGRAARERAERCFSVGAMMRRIETLYGELLGNAPTFHSDQARRWTV
jgi:glycosyltransferase involved in cell wall biosynthesis